MTFADSVARDMQRKAVFLGALAATLCISTFAVFETPWRYVPTSPVVLVDNREADAGSERGWSIRGNAAEDGGDDSVRLTADAGSAIPAAGRLLAKTEETEFVRATAEAKAEGIIAGRELWQVGRLLVVSYDSQGRLLARWPMELAMLDGDSDWRRYELVVPVAGQVAQMRVLAYNAAVSGTMKFRNLSAGALSERPIFVGLRYALMLGWVVFGGLALATLIGSRGPQILKYATMVIAAIIVMGALTPQPLFDQLTRPVETWLGALSERLLPGDRTAGSSDADAGATVRLVAGGESSELNPSDVADTSGGKDPPAINHQSAFFDAPSPDSAFSDDMPFTFEELMHFSGFALLAALVLLTYRSVALPVVTAFLLLTGPMTECLQLFLITRGFEWHDVQVDWAGTATGVFLVIAWMSLRGSVRQLLRCANWP